ncbi:MAG: hypothetical protein ABH869_02955 [Candidatus Omnitrophota bacterium]
MKRKKKFLQACEFNDSIYGTKRIAGKRNEADKQVFDGNDLIASYNKLYKTQFDAMSKIFKKSR